MAPGSFGFILTVLISNSFYGLIFSALLIILLSGECHGSPLMISRYWFGLLWSGNRPLLQPKLTKVYVAIVSLGAKGLTLTFVSAIYLPYLSRITGTCAKLSVSIIWMFRIVRKLQIKFFEDRCLIMLREATEASYSMLLWTNWQFIEICHVSRSFYTLKLTDLPHWGMDKTFSFNHICDSNHYINLCWITYSPS